MVAAEVKRRILARKTLPPRYLGGYGSCDDFLNSPCVEAGRISLLPPKCAETERGCVRSSAEHQPQHLRGNRGIGTISPTWRIGRAAAGPSDTAAVRW